MSETTTNGNGKIGFGGLGVEKEKLAAWIFRLCLVIAFLWAHQNFVSIKDYQRDAAEEALESKQRTHLLQDMSTNLALIKQRLETDDTRQRVNKLEEAVHAIDKRMEGARP